MSKPINRVTSEERILNAYARTLRQHGWTCCERREILCQADASFSCPSVSLCSSYRRKQCEDCGTCGKLTGEYTWNYRRSQFRRCRYYELTVAVMLRGPKNKDSDWTPKRKEQQGL